jgi:hypothetical protein
MSAHQENLRGIIIQALGTLTLQNIEQQAQISAQAAAIRERDEKIAELTSGEPKEER